MWAMMKRPWFLALKVRAIAPGVICVTVSDVVAREELLLRLLHIDIWRPRLEETHDAVDKRLDFHDANTKLDAVPEDGNSSVNGKHEHYFGQVCCRRLYRKRRIRGDIHRCWQRFSRGHK